jgi:hypothetical protein
MRRRRAGKGSADVFHVNGETCGSYARVASFFARVRALIEKA